MKAIRFIIGFFSAHHLSVVIFFVTNRCNAACRTCFYWKNLNQPIQELTIDEIAKIASGLGQFETLQISGGEPYLRNDLSRICKIFVTVNKVHNIHIPTNGLLPNKIFSETEKIVQLDKKTRVRLCCALDGVGAEHDQIRGVEGNFEKFLETIDLLKKLKHNYENFTFAALTTLCRENYRNFEKIHNFVCDNLGVPHEVDIVRRGTAREKSVEEIPLNFINEFCSDEMPKNDRTFTFQERAGQNIQYERMKTFNRFYRKAIEGQRGDFLCSAGKNIFVIEPHGGVRLCEKRDAIGNLREHNYEIKKVLVTPKARDMKREIKNSLCNCDNRIFLSMRLSSNRYYRLRNVALGLFRTSVW